MSNFQTVLQETLKGINKAFQVADADLHEEVAVASKAVANVTDGKGALELVVIGEDESGLSYNLMLTTEEKKLQLGSFHVPRKGYPIITSHGAIPARQELAGLFANMATNPDSPLVTKLAFLLRQHGG